MTVSLEYLVYFVCLWLVTRPTVILANFLCNIDVCMFVWCMYVFMYACMFYVFRYVCIYVCMCMCTHTHICVCLNVYMYVCMYVCMHVCMYVYMYISTHICMYVRLYIVCTYLCMYVSIYVCICMYVCMYECHKRQPWPRRVSNPYSQQVSCRRTTHQTARRLGSITLSIYHWKTWYSIARAAKFLEFRKFGVLFCCKYNNNQGPNILLRTDSTDVKISVLYKHAAFKMGAGGELLAVRGEQVTVWCRLPH